MKYLFLSLRPKHWVKNLLIFLPLIFGRKLFDLPLLLKSMAAFFLFSMASGAAYVMNDAMDIEKDKTHPVKRLRPIASGKFGIRQALIAACILGAISLALSFMLDASFGWLVLIYLIFNFVYTKALKEIVIIDVFCIGIFFLLRVIAGSIIANVELSHWIIFMIILLSLFLGFSKRRHELTLLQENANSHRNVLTRYNPYFIDQMIMVITSSIVVVYMLYTVDARTVGEFGSNHLIYSIPFVYYGIFRYLYFIHMRRKGGDPANILFADYKMQLNLLLWIVICIAVIYFGL